MEYPKPLTKPELVPDAINGVSLQPHSGGRVRRFFKNQSAIPFETTFAVFCALGGLTAFIAGPDSSNIFSRISAVFGYYVAQTINFGYFIAGCSLYLGVGFRGRNIESFGLILIITMLIIRVCAILWVMPLGMTLVNALIFYGAFIVASLVRLNTVLKGKVFVVVP